MNIDKIDQKTIELVEQFGWSKMNVWPLADDPDPKANFTYTINLDEFCGLPELIVFGLPEEVSAGVFGGIIDRAQDGWHWSGENEQLEEILVGYPVELRPVHPSQIGEYFTCSISFRRVTNRAPMTSAVQVYWPDKESRFPWDEGLPYDLFEQQPNLQTPTIPESTN